MLEQSKPPPAWRDVLWLMLGLGLLYFGTSWMRPFANPDEGRYAEIPREMAASGDWITPRLNGVLYFEKPPLGYWLGALAIKVAGLHETALRFWPAALGLLTCLVVYATGRRLYGRTAGLASAGVLGTTLLWFGMSQILTLDMAVSAFTSTALCLFLLAVREPARKSRLGLMLGVYGSLGLATLSKGLMGVLVPGAIMFLWALLLNRWRKLVPLYLWIGVPLFLAITVPWHVLAAQATPPQPGSAGFFSTTEDGQGFLWYHIVHEQVLRYFTTIHRRTEPFWFFFTVLPAGLLPWVSFLPQAVESALPGGWAGRRERLEEWFFVIWALFILLFFSTSQSKLIPYILPAYPPLALLLGRFVASLWERHSSARLQAALNALGSMSLLLAIVAAMVLAQRPWNTDAPKWPLISALVGGLAISAGVAFWCAARRDFRRGMLAPVLCAGTIMLSFGPLSAAVMRPSAKAVCLNLKPRLAPGTLVFCLRDYYQDVPFYLDRLVGVADMKFDNPNFEQSFGLSLENHRERYLNADAFLSRWRGSERVFAIASVSKQAAFAAANPDWHPHLLFSDGNFVLLSNQPDA